MSDVHVLYRMYDHDGELLYVGITNNPLTRFREHGAAKDWWALVGNIGIATFDSRGELEAAERAAILAEKPRYNIAHAGRAPRRKVPPPLVRLSVVRKSLGHSLQDVCDRVTDLGVFISPATLSAYEAGECNIGPELVDAIMAALGMASVAPIYPEVAA